jgi:hypothetical protein
VPDLPRLRLVRPVFSALSGSSSPGSSNYKDKSWFAALKRLVLYVSATSCSMGQSLIYDMPKYRRLLRLLVKEILEESSRV